MTEKKKVRVLITVKTYPTFSVTHEEVVCTAGFTEDGKWIRLYPIQYRKLDYASQYKKYDWVEVDVVRNTSDFRPETYTPVGSIKTVSHLDTVDNWRERKKVVLREVYTNLDQLIVQTKRPHFKSLAVFKPTIVHDFTWMPTTRDWDQRKLKVLDQMRIFEKSDSVLKPVRKLPYKFLLKFEDNAGNEMKRMIEDWEIGALYWNCLEKHGNDEESACKDLRAKYLDDFSKKKDLYFFLGTPLQHHFKPHPFIIIGTFHPKKELQTTLL